MAYRDRGRRGSHEGRSARLDHDTFSDAGTEAEEGASSSQNQVGKETGFFARQRSSQSEDQDLEMGPLKMGPSGTGPTSEYAGHPIGYPRTAFDERFMFYRRFAWLHSQVLLCRQTELEELYEQTGNGSHQEDVSKFSTRRLFKILHPRLKEYEPMVLSMKSLRGVPKPNNGCRTSARDYIRNGPPIILDYLDSVNPLWTGYTAAVTELLNDSSSSDWLDETIDYYWIENLGKPSNTRLQKWMGALKHRRKSIIVVLSLLFWIFHITAAFGIPLIANTTDNQTKPASWLVLCLIFWYFTAAGIVVRGFMYHRYLYARKIVFGGVVACAGGLYILSFLLLIPTASAVTALPALLTFVLLLIQTM